MKLAMFTLFALVPWALGARAHAQLKPPTLRDEARQKGFVWRTVIGDNFSLLTFDDLVKGSALIVKGRVVDERTRLSTDEQNVWTNYTVEVVEILKDWEKLAKVGERLTVTKGGGNLLIEGKPLRIDTPNFPPIQWILPHVFFISRRPASDADGQYSFFGGELGVFPIDKGSVVCQSAEKMHHPVSKPFCGRNERDFLQLLKDKIAAQVTSSAGK